MRYGCFSDKTNIAFRLPYYVVPSEAVIQGHPVFPQKPSSYQLHIYIYMYALSCDWINCYANLGL